MKVAFRMNIPLDIQELADVMNAISHQATIQGMFHQLPNGDVKLLKEYWDENIAPTRDAYFNDFYNLWRSCDLHVVSQTWGNTSCGWEGIGGSAMSTAFTTILENKHFALAFIYYNGKLAYICKMDEAYIGTPHDRLPGITRAKTKLDVIYRSRY